jgi:hypothetical protein
VCRQLRQARSTEFDGVLDQCSGKGAVVVPESLSLGIVTSVFRFEVDNPHTGNAWSEFPSLCHSNGTLKRIVPSKHRERLCFVILAFNEANLVTALGGGGSGLVTCH